METFGETMARVVAKAKTGPPSDPVDIGAPACATCRGAEWLRLDVPVDDPRFGQATPCPDCAPVVAQRRLNKLWGDLPFKFRDWTIYSLIDRAAATDERSIVALVAMLKEEWIPSNNSLYLWGRPGRGKTGLAIGLLVELIRSGKSGLFKIVPDMLDAIRASYRNHEAMADDANAGALMSSLYSVDVLVLDDIGTEKASDWVSQMMFQIIGNRHANEKRTIFTSNVNLTDLAEHLGHPRTPSRIREMTQDGYWEIEVCGNNLRSESRLA